ncbi:MAG: hypothetical protein K0Q60_2944, partial [Microvirga sp.]|nr:hypothetical protein [Microvirga sp.]
KLLFNDPWLNFQTVYAAFKGSQRFCTGDGEEAERLQDDGTVKRIGCPCHLLDPGYNGSDKCKINGTLSVVIDGAPVVGGVWKLRTTSINTCQGIASSLTLLSGLTGGQIAGVPLMLTLRPKAAVTPGGQSTTVYVVGLEYRGSIEQLRQFALERATADAAFGERMNRVEEQARLMLAAPPVGSNDMEHVEEFYPKAAASAHDAELVEIDPDTGEVHEPTPRARPGHRVYDESGKIWSVCMTLNEAFLAYRAAKDAAKDKSVVAVRNLELLRKGLEAAKNGQRKRFEDEIATAEAIKDQVDILDEDAAKPVFGEQEISA